MRVAVGAVRSMVTVAAVTTAAGPVLAAASLTLLAARARMTVPWEQPLSATLYELPEPDGAPTTQPVAVPVTREVTCREARDGLAEGDGVRQARRVGRRGGRGEGGRGCRAVDGDGRRRDDGRRPALAAASLTLLAARARMTVPSEQPLTATLYELPSPTGPRPRGRCGAGDAEVTAARPVTGRRRGRCPQARRVGRRGGRGEGGRGCRAVDGDGRRRDDGRRPGVGRGVADAVGRQGQDDGAMGDRLSAHGACPERPVRKPRAASGLGEGAGRPGVSGPPTGRRGRNERLVQCRQSRSRMGGRPGVSGPPTGRRGREQAPPVGLL